MANAFRVGARVVIRDGRTIRSLWTQPPMSRSFTVEDVVDGTMGRVVAVWAGGTVYTVGLSVPGLTDTVFGAFAEQELRKAGVPTS